MSALLVIVSTKCPQDILYIYKRAALSYNEKYETVAAAQLCTVFQAMAFQCF